jgi:hypothetical protein
LLHPVALAAIALLILNDHVLKRAFPGGVTGKLSDFAGLTFFPLLLAAVFESALRARGRVLHPKTAQRVTWLCIAATALVFSWVNLSSAGAHAYRVGLGLLQWPGFAALDALRGEGLRGPHLVHFTQDASDLMALPALAFAAWSARRRLGRLTVDREARRRQPVPGVGLKMVGESLESDLVGGAGGNPQ